jgi:hypothetical protein
MAFSRVMLRAPLLGTRGAVFVRERLLAYSTFVKTVNASGGRMRPAFIELPEYIARMRRTHRIRLCH